MAIGERKTLVFENPFCKIIGRCGENVGKIGYKNGLQVSVGHLRVPCGLPVFEPIYGRLGTNI